MNRKLRCRDERDAIIMQPGSNPLPKCKSQHLDLAEISMCSLPTMKFSAAPPAAPAAGGLRAAAGFASAFRAAALVRFITHVQACE